jgi:hypothetical protein
VTRRARVRAALLAVPTVLLLLGAGAGPALADSSGTGTGSGAAAGTGGPSALGGYTLSATGSGVSVYYEQPNFPVPATPTLEADLGYSTAGFDAGPTGQSLASAVWPGPVAANGASQLNLLVGPYLQPYFGANTPTLPNPGPWPVQASTSFPQGPDTQSDDNGTIDMNASSTGTASTADAALGALGGAAAIPAGIVTAQTVGSTVQSTVDSAGSAVAQATSAVHGVSVAGGLITVGQVTSTATATSDGNQATVKGSSTVAQVSVAGQAVTVDASGVHSPSSAAGTVPVLGTLLPSAAQVLSTAGITMTLTNPTDTVAGPSGTRQLDGLQIAIDLSTLDKNLAALAAMLPSQLSAAVSQLPLPLPDKQVITIDLGWVNVGSAASPPYASGLGGTTGGTTPSLPLPGGLGTSGTTTADLGSAGSPGTPGTAGTAGTPAGGGGGSAAGSPAGTQPVLATTPVGLFKGVGAGLIVLGLVLAGLLAFVLLRADAAVGALAAAPPCVGEEAAALATEGST